MNKHAHLSPRGRALQVDRILVQGLRWKKRPIQLGRCNFPRDWVKTLAWKSATHCVLPDSVRRTWSS